MIKKRFGKQLMGCKHIKGTKSYRCSPLHKKKHSGRNPGKGSLKRTRGVRMRMAKKRAAAMPGGKGPVRNRPAGRKILNH